MKGVVVKNTGSWYTVRGNDGSMSNCKIRGNFRLKDINSTNPVAVGDVVETDGPLITFIHDRRNYIIRKSPNLSKQCHIIAANVDQALLMVTVAHPVTSAIFIDRFLASAEAYRVPVILLFNKTDLLTSEERLCQRMMVALYENIDYECYEISAAPQTADGAVVDHVGGKVYRERPYMISGSRCPCPLEEGLRRVLADRISVVSGNSGVGKSTLINALIPGANLRAADISAAHDRGTHTTTFSEMLPLFASNGTRQVSGYIIDTPGIKGFGSFQMNRYELSGYFREIFRWSRKCRFSNCTHTHEPGCAVLQAVKDHHIAESRYRSYLSMLDDEDEDKYRPAY